MNRAISIRTSNTVPEQSKKFDAFSTRTIERVGSLDEREKKDKHEKTLYSLDRLNIPWAILFILKLIIEKRC